MLNSGSKKLFIKVSVSLISVFKVGVASRIQRRL